MIDFQAEFKFLSELYERDAADAILLPEYPSSNSTETIFQNPSKYIIHDPFPPPPQALLKVLGPHHLICGWGKRVKVTTEVAPPAALIEHWRSVFGEEGCPDWHPYDGQANYLTLFPHESIAAQQQVIDPAVNYAIHSKEVIAEIDCPQAQVFEQIQFPCVVKLSHGYAGLGNFFILNASDEAAMRQQLEQQWPQARLVINEVIEQVNGDFGIQFFLNRDGTMQWMGYTDQLFNAQARWCGGTFSAGRQMKFVDEFASLIEPAGRHLHQCGYFGVVGIDILRNDANQFFLVDVNPRLTGITPFLVASRQFAHEGITEGIYQASCRFPGSLEQLIDTVEKEQDARVLILSAFEDPQERMTICHCSVSSASQDRNQQVLHHLFGKTSSAVSEISSPSCSVTK